MNRPAFYFLGFILMMLLATSAYASAVQLAWDPSTSSGVAGYRVYRSEQMGVYTSSPLNGSTPVTTTSWTDSSVTQCSHLLLRGEDRKHDFRRKHQFERGISHDLKFGTNHTFLGPY